MSKNMWFSYFWDWVTLLSRPTHFPENYSKHCWQNWMSTQRKINFSPVFTHPRTPKGLIPNLNPWNCWWKSREYMWSFKYRNKNFLNRTPIVQEIVPRGNKPDYMKLRSFCTARQTISRANRMGEKSLPVIPQLGGWQLAYIKNYKAQTIKLIIDKWANKMSRHISKESTHMAKYYFFWPLGNGN